MSALTQGRRREGAEPPDGEAALAVELKGLARRHGERIALTDVTLGLPAGASLVVFGANGAGKSTLLRVLAGLLRPHAGRVRVLGCALPDEAWALRGRVGLVAHEPLLYRELTARENLRFHASLHGAPAQRAEQLLDQVGLAMRADEPLRSLSRGQVQRVAVCRAVLHRPELLLLDEPAAHLDPAAAARVEALVGRATASTRVIASHDPRGGLAEADLALGLRGGRPAFLAPAAQLAPSDVAGLYG